jgi:hypothetical protein
MPQRAFDKKALLCVSVQGVCWPSCLLVQGSNHVWVAWRKPCVGVSTKERKTNISLRAVLAEILGLTGCTLRGRCLHLEPRDNAALSGVESTVQPEVSTCNNPPKELKRYVAEIWLHWK